MTFYLNIINEWKYNKHYNNVHVIQRDLMIMFFFFIPFDLGVKYNHVLDWFNEFCLDCLIPSEVYFA